MSVEKRIENLERSLRFWKLAVALMGIGSLLWNTPGILLESQASQKVPVAGEFDTITTKSLVLVNNDGVPVGFMGIINGVVKLTLGPNGQPHRAELTAMDKGASLSLHGHKSSLVATALGMAFMNDLLQEFVAIGRETVFGGGYIRVNGSVEVNGSLRVQD